MTFWITVQNTPKLVQAPRVTEWSLNYFSHVAVWHLLQLKHSPQYFLLGFFQTSSFCVAFQWFHHFSPRWVFFSFWYIVRELTDLSGTANIPYTSVKSAAWWVMSRCDLSYLPTQNLECGVQNSIFCTLNAEGKGHNVSIFFSVMWVLGFFLK